MVVRIVTSHKRLSLDIPTLEKRKTARQAPGSSLVVSVTARQQYSCSCRGTANLYLRMDRRGLIQVTGAG
jgi:hypothetical protein